MDRLIYLSRGHIPNLGPLGPLLHVEKFVVGGGWWSRPILVLSLSLKLNNNLYKLTVSAGPVPLDQWFFGQMVLTFNVPLIILSPVPIVRSIVLLVPCYLITFVHRTITTLFLMFLVLCSTGPLVGFQTF